MADFNVGWYLSEYQYSPNRGPYTWQHEVLASIQRNERKALEISVSYQRNALRKWDYNNYYYDGVLGAQYFDGPDAENYHVAKLGVGLRFANRKRPARVYFKPSIYYGFAYSSAPVFHNRLAKLAPGYEPHDLRGATHGLGIRFEWGLQRALSDRLMLRAGLRLGIGVGFHSIATPDSDFHYTREEQLDNNLKFDMSERFIIDELISIRIGLGFGLKFAE